MFFAKKIFDGLHFFLDWHAKEVYIPVRGKEMESARGGGIWNMEHGMKRTNDTTSRPESAKGTAERLCTKTPKNLRLQLFIADEVTEQAAKK
ncbi:MAG TPA: hypothetical protein VKS81_11150 [Bacteroidota bacterium]|nr:hypothetical protein [Bacteroidota bacterium]